MLQRRTASGRTSVQRVERSGDAAASGGAAAVPSAGETPLVEPAQRAATPSAARPAWFAGRVGRPLSSRSLPCRDSCRVCGRLVALSRGSGSAGSVTPLHIATDHWLGWRSEHCLGSDFAGRPPYRVQRHRIARIALVAAARTGTIPIQIEGVLGARDVFWSPDGNFIGFATSRGVGKVALRGLAVTMLVEESGFAPIRAAWSADGQWIAYVSAGGVPMRARVRSRGFSASAAASVRAAAPNHDHQSVLRQHAGRQTALHLWRTERRRLHRDGAAYSRGTDRRARALG